MRWLPLLFASTLAAQPPDLSGSFILPLEDEAIRYDRPSADNPVARLQRQINRGEVTLDYSPTHGYLPAVLKALGIPVSSQTLVFSKTSFQLTRISPATPRALYFNDDTYIGWVRDGEVVEVSTVDPMRGGVFYTLDQRKTDRPQFARRDECLQCHASPRTLGVPGHIVRSVYADSEGFPFTNIGSFNTDHNSPFAERWGGWYVTGTHGAGRHMGNQIATNRQDPDKMDLDPGANVTSLAARVDVSPYLSPHSDIVALMILQHQTKMHNLITRVSYETRIAISSQIGMNKALGRPPDEMSDSTKRRIYGPAEVLLRYMLFADEPPLAAPIRGTSAFAREFAKGGPLRDLDLEKRLFKVPCSFLIGSDAFKALPKQAKDYIDRRLEEVLSGEDQSKAFAALSDGDRAAIRKALSH